jgi:mannose-6-phosphate isomerase-like protein (cupin superfamily)
MVHDGRWQVEWNDGHGGSGKVALASGDTMDVPEGVAHSLAQTGSGEGLCWMVTRGDQPAAPQRATMAVSQAPL